MQSQPQSQETLLVHYLLQIAIVVFVSRIGGNFAVAVRQPRAVGEIVAGLVLGPSLFGAFAPEAFHWIFRAVDAAPMTIMSQLGLIMLMFQVGMQFEFSHLAERRNRRAVIWVSLFSLIVPFVLGIGFGWATGPKLAPVDEPWAYRLFLGVALAITAVPILGRILVEFKLNQSRIGVIAIASAAANDVIGWIMLAVVAAIATRHFSLDVVITQLVLLAAYVMASWFVVRRVLRFTLRHVPHDPESFPQDLLAGLLILVFGSAILTAQLGIFAIFGGFIVGVLLHEQKVLADAWNRKVSDLLSVLFLPIFFTYTGLRTEIGSLDSWALWGWCGLLVALAVLGKFGGASVAARLAGLPLAEAGAIGILMNTRALMELVVANLGYDLGVLPKEIFTMLVLMAVISTVMAAPGLRFWLAIDNKNLKPIPQRISVSGEK